MDLDVQYSTLHQKDPKLIALTYQTDERTKKDTKIIFFENSSGLFMVYEKFCIRENCLPAFTKLIEINKSLEKKKIFLQSS